METTNPTLARIPAYLQWLQVRDEPPPVSAGTLTAYRSKLRQFVEWAGERPVTVELLRQYFRYLETKRPGLRGVGQRPRTIKCAVVPLYGYLAWLQEHHPEIPTPNLRSVPRPRLDEPDREVPTEEEVSRLFQAAQAMGDYTLQERYRRAQALAVLTLSVDCALRRSEILSLEVADLHLKQSTPEVHVRFGKGEKTRSVPLNSRAQRLLREYLEVRREWCDHQPDRHQNQALFAVNRSMRLDEDALLRLRHYLLQKAKIERNLHLHSFRHYCLSKVLEAPGVTIADAARIAGHTSTLTTQTYLHARKDAMVRGLESVCEEAPAKERPARAPRRHVRRPRSH